VPANTRHNCALLGALLLTLFTSPGQAQSLQGDLSPYDHPAYAAIASHFLLNNATYGTALWSYMNELLDAVENSSVTSAYQGSLPIYATLDTRPRYQDYILITSDLAYPNLPEPGTALLSLLGATLLFRRRR